MRSHCGLHGPPCFVVVHRYVATFASSAVAIQIEQNAGNGSRSDRGALVSLLTFRALEQQPAYCEAA